MIFAKLYVCMATHPKFAKAGPAATGYWTAVLAYIRSHELDGQIPDESLAIPLGLAPDVARTLADKLVEVGLFARREGGYELLGYADKNETPDDIELRKVSDRVRKRAARAVERSRVSDPVQRECPQDFPISLSISISDSDPERVQGEPIASSANVERNAARARPRAVPIANTAAAVPSDFEPSAESRAYAEQLALKDIDAVVRKFRAVAVEKGWVTHDAEAKFRLFCEHELRFQRRERDRDEAHAKGGRRADEPVGPARRILQ